MKDGFTIDTWPIMTERGLYDNRTGEMVPLLKGYGASLTEELPDGHHFIYTAENPQSARLAVNDIIIYVKTRIDEYTELLMKLNEIVYGEEK